MINIKKDNKIIKMNNLNYINIGNKKNKIQINVNI